MATDALRAMQRIGRYEVIEELGRGSMGAVFKARDPQIGRTVAIKIILTANLAPDDLEPYKQRFQREAQAAGQMSHPGIVTIHDIAEDETGQPYLVMEFIEGTALDKLLGPGAERLPLSRCLDVCIQVAEALDYAHRRGVVHRDVKPANILLTADGGAKIADFGIAKFGDVQLTRAGQMMGTPAFMSPEQFSGGPVDARSDLFSLGAMLYWMLTGEKPFAGETLTAVSFKIVYTAPIPARQLNPALPPEADTVLSRLLAKNPEERYPSCRELVTDLRALREGKNISTQPVPVPTMEQTVSVPVLGTVRPGSAPAATPPGAIEATKRETPVAGVPLHVEVTPAGFWTRGRKIAAAALLILLLLLAGYWLWPSAEQMPAEETTPPPAEPAPRRATTKKAAPRQQPPAPEPAAKEPAAQQPTVEEILRQKGQEILQDQIRKKPGKGKGRR